jgi:hypothetical protein
MASAADDATRDDSRNFGFHLEPPSVLKSLDREQVGLLEKFNRADRAHLARLKALIVPGRWTGEIDYSTLPGFIPDLASERKALVIYLPGQMFGAYESGHLVLWGPVSSGNAGHPTPSGSFHLNWRSRLQISTDNKDWIMPWYWNFSNFRGLGLHQYELPGYPASHACIRLLERDAKWIYQWGEGWQLSPNGQKILRQGTPLQVIGQYDYSKPAPWLDPEWWKQTVPLPELHEHGQDGVRPAPEPG